MKSLSILRISFTIALLSILKIGQAHHGEMMDHVANNLVYYGPAFLIVAATAVWYFRKKRSSAEGSGE